MSERVSVRLALGLCASLAFAWPPAPEPQARSQIAFLRWTSGFWQLWLMDPDGSGQAQLTRSPVDKVHAAWRPGGREILYHTNRGDSFLLELRSGRERPVLEGLSVRDAGFRPDGNAVAYGVSPEDKVNGKTTLWVSGLAGKDRRQVAGGVGIDALAPTWTSEKSILYRQCVMTSHMEVHHDFWVLELEGNSGRAVPGDDEPLKFDQVASVSGVLAYSSARSGLYEIWTLDPSTGERRQLTTLQSYAGNPTWSPEGKLVAFDSDRSGSIQIYRIDAEGRNLVQLTSGERPSRKPVWSLP